MYSREQKSTALKVFHQTNSVSVTIRILGYPTRRQLYTWTAAENMVIRECKQSLGLQIPQSIQEILHWTLNLMQLGVALNTERI